VTRREIEEKGAVLVWQATDTTGRPPAEILRQFPDLVTEVPRAFTRRFQGRMPLLRLGWGMIRPHTPGVTPEPLPEPQPPQPIPAPPPEPQWQMPQFPQTPPQAQQPAAPAPSAAPAPATREQPQRQPRTVPQLERHAPQ
jgi:outer membrane biosynthesis protein TonB